MLTSCKPYPLLAVVLLAACAEDPPPDEQLVATPIPEPHVSFDVAWKPETVILDEDEQANRDVSFDTGAVRIGDPSLALLALAPGDHVLVHGQGLFEVLDATQMDDGALLLEVGEGSLLEAASAGRIEWDVTLDPQSATVLMPADADPAWAVQKQLSNKLEFEGSLNGVAGKISIEPNGDRLDISVTGEIATPTPYEITGKGWIKRVRTTGTYEFEDGEVTEYEQGIGDFEMDGQFSIGGQGRHFEQALSFPVGLYFPLVLGPMPAFIGISGELEFRSTAMSEDSGEVGGHVHLDGEAGFTLLENDSVGVAGAMEAKALEVQPGPYSTKFTSGIAYSMDFPRYDFGFGLVSGISVTKPSTAAVLFMKVTVESVQNVQVLVNRSTGERRWCREATTNTGIYVGGELRTLGLSLEIEDAVWAQKGEPAINGPNCD